MAEKYVAVGVTLPMSLLEKLDAKAAELAEKDGSEPNRSAVIRRALLKFLEDGKDDG